MSGDYHFGREYRASATLEEAVMVGNTAAHLLLACRVAHAEMERQDELAEAKRSMEAAQRRMAELQHETV